MRTYLFSIRTISIAEGQWPVMAKMTKQPRQSDRPRRRPDNSRFDVFLPLLPLRQIVDDRKDDKCEESRSRKTEEDRPDEALPIPDRK
jgi:hypothetical protein